MVIVEKVASGFCIDLNGNLRLRRDVDFGIRAAKLKLVPHFELRLQRLRGDLGDQLVFVLDEIREHNQMQSFGFQVFEQRRA